MLTQLTDRDVIRRYLRALRREQLLARVRRDEDRVQRLLGAQAVAVEGAPLVDMGSLLERPDLRDRVSAIVVDEARLDGADRELLDRVLRRADAVCRLRRQQAAELDRALSGAQRTGA
jgi:hypothetical protein